MSKIYIIGIVASGKTTLARRVSKELNILSIITKICNKIYL